LVTVTEEAVVRVWELSTTDRWSFDRPTLAIDLRKLADGTSLDQDFSASKFGAGKTFSPDSIEMEVASACFGGSGSGGWSPMTLWVAMREGDVYALCPLLPEKWAPPPTLIPSLSVSIVAKAAIMEDDLDYSEETKRLSHQQLDWMSDLDNQEPIIAEGPVGRAPAEVYLRPQKPGRVPKLQGPFIFDLAPEESDNELDDLLTDIYVIGPKLDADALMAGEDDELEFDKIDEEGLSVTIVCLVTSSGRVSVCLDLDGVEAQWLPSRKSKQLFVEQKSTPPSLLTYQVLDTLRRKEVSEDNWPMFSQDVASRYSFFITNWSNVTFISLSPWVFRLESELQNGPGQGIDFRLDLMAKGENFIRERLISEDPSRGERALAACTTVRDPDLGYFLLTNSSHGPIALTMATPEDDFNIQKLISESPVKEEFELDNEPLLLCPPRPVYEPSPAFTTPLTLPGFHENLRHGKNKRLLYEPIRLSPVTLTIFADAHKVLSEETYRIGTAAAELFRRCEKLQIDLREQIAKANEVAHRVEQVIGEDYDVDESYIGGNQGIEERIEIAKERQLELVERFERIRKKASKGAGRELSDREKVWFEEVNALNSSISKESRADGRLPRGAKKMELWRRFEEVKDLKEDILQRVGELGEREERPAAETGADSKIPSEVRKEKVAQVMHLIERETALVEGVKGRLERLNLV
jgi:nucleoporin NUP82